jgi:hypothetical protein
MKHIIPFLLAVVIAGCAAPRPGPNGAAAAKPSLDNILASEADTLLGRFADLRQMPVAELARELEVARSAFLRQPSDTTRVRFALALAAAGRSGDSAKGIEILEPVVKNPDASLHALAVLLNSRFIDQRRLEVDLGAAQLKAETVQQKLDALQQKFDAAQQKLDALKTLEKDMSERREGKK